MSVAGKYVYCITAAQPDGEQVRKTGIDGADVYSLCFNGLAAVVSDTPAKKYPVAREHLILHEAVVEEIMKNRAVLPVRFCTIADDEQMVMKILAREHDRFIDLLREIDGKVELGLKAVFKEGAIYRDIVADYDEIRIKKEEIEKNTDVYGRQKLMEIGAMIENALEQEKTRFKEHILKSLEPFSVKFKVNKTYGERMIINASFLVDKAKENLVDLRVNELNDRYGTKITFKYVGPLPPFNFVTVTIATGGYATCF